MTNIGWYAINQMKLNQTKLECIMKEMHGEWFYKNAS